MIDLSFDNGCKKGIDRAFRQLNELANRNLAPEQYVLIHYFRANAWSAKAKIANGNVWDWEHPETQEEILELSLAANHEGFSSLDKIRRCQILTNRANILKRVGRFIDAI